ncbi:30S ribosomal protein S2 (plastid) [Lotharella oceanica]|uniref:30S ribosomal protein S2 n=1 Tax=Lotharella oceanica TaxID=641309 RepID=A0A059SLV2_9EUKA|nr:30S ribosomal protein S2 [Lotharella oceanica]
MTTHTIIEFNRTNQLFIHTNKKANIDYNEQKFILKMLKAGVHLGHKIKRWNPKMSGFIYQKMQGIHIIDIIQSYMYLRKACQLLYTTASNTNYKTFLFTGTQEQSPIPNSVIKNASRCGSFYINKKWLSGTLTNWKNTKKSLNTLKYLKLYQKTKSFEKISVKMQSIIEKKIYKLERYFGGIQNMMSLPNVVIIVGQQSQINASKECQKLKIKNITILDTDCNPELVEMFIPANDDSSSSLNLILGELQTAINLGRQVFCKNINFQTNIQSIFQII